MSRKSSKESWFGVRCIFRGHTIAEQQYYEERVTIWRAASFSGAIKQAEAEALEYALPSQSYVGYAQAYLLEGKPTAGSEVFSLMRESALEPADYLKRFFDTGSERQAEKV